jgi:hypothetical protein
MKTFKKILAILTITLVTTLIFIQTPTVSAGQENVQEKVINALKDVAGIDIDKYTINIDGYWNSPTPGNEEMYRGEEDLDLTLKSDKSQIGVMSSCLNNSWFYMYMYIEAGSSSSVHYVNKLSDDPLVATREVLSRLQKFTGNPVISDIQKILESAKNINDLNGKTVGNIKCVVHTDPNIVESNGMYPVSGVYFMYSVNGAESPKSIGVHFQNGFFKGFHDTWNLYPIGSEEMKVSGEQAIEMAREHAIAAAESVSLEFPSDREVIAELSFEVRDDFMLYPFWFVEIPIVYPLDESVYGWQEGIWADTGEMLYGHPVGGYGVMPDASVPSSTQSTETSWLLVIGIISTIAIVGLIAIVARKKR